MFELLIKSGSRLDQISRFLNKEIEYIQVYTDKVLIFEESFLWFKKRSRMSRREYETILVRTKKVKSFNEIEHLFE